MMKSVRPGKGTLDKRRWQEKKKKRGRRWEESMPSGTGGRGVRSGQSSRKGQGESVGANRQNSSNNELLEAREKGVENSELQALTIRRMMAHSHGHSSTQPSK